MFNFHWFVRDRYVNKQHEKAEKAHATASGKESDLENEHNFANGDLHRAVVHRDNRKVDLIVAERELEKAYKAYFDTFDLHALAEESVASEKKHVKRAFKELQKARNEKFSAAKIKQAALEYKAARVDLREAELEIFRLECAFKRQLRDLKGKKLEAKKKLNSSAADLLSAKIKS